MIFHTLVDVATGQKEIGSALRELRNEIPWEELELQDEETRSWFSAGKYIVLQLLYRPGKIHHRPLTEYHRHAPKDVSLLAVNFTEPLSKGWPFHEHLRQEAGSSFKVNGVVPPPQEQVLPTGNDSGSTMNTTESSAAVQNRGLGTTGPQDRSDTIDQVRPEPAAGPSAGDCRDIDGSTAGLNSTVAEAVSRASDSNGNQEGPTNSGLGPAAAILNTSPGPSNSKSTEPPSTGGRPADDSVAAAVKRHQRGLNARLAAAAAAAANSGTSTIIVEPSPSRKRRSTRKKKSTKSAGPESKTLMISVDTATLVKQSLREHYWDPVKVKMVTPSVPKYPGGH